MPRNPQVSLHGKCLSCGYLHLVSILQDFQDAFPFLQRASPDFFAKLKSLITPTAHSSMILFLERTVLGVASEDEMRHFFIFIKVSGYEDQKNCYVVQ
jgi:hypothetical protein